MAVDMTKGRKWKITHDEAVQRITAEHLDQVLHPQFKDKNVKVLAKGLAASPGRGGGQGLLHRRRLRRRRRPRREVILVRSETSPEDVHGMSVAEGILTARGGLVSHAAVVARGWGKPAVVGAEKIAHLGHELHGRRRHRARRRRAVDQRHDRRGRAGRGRAVHRRGAEGVRRRSSVGPTTSARASWRCAPTPTTGPTRPTPASSAPRASASAAPSTCSSATTGCRSCAA